MRRLALTLSAFITLFAGRASADIVYAITDLGTLGGNSSQANGINNAGQVVGESVNAAGFSRGFLWTPGGTGGVITNPQMRDLGVLSGHSTSLAYGINASGLVTGISFSASDPNNGLGYIWTAGATDGTPGNLQMKSLGTLGGPHSTGISVLNSGQVVGEADPTGTNAPGLAMLWTPGGTNGVPSNPQMRNLGSLSNASAANAMNASGLIVGWTKSSNANQRAMLYNGSTMTDLGTLFGTGPSSFGVYSSAVDINDAGLIVGWSGSGNGFRAFKYQSGTMTSLGDLGGTNRELFATAVNQAGLIVGQEAPAGQSAAKAFLYDSSGIHDLNAMVASGSGWILQSAHDINDLNQIVGYGTFAGQTHAFLLTPAPEPSSLILGSLGLCVMTAYRKRRKAKSRRRN